MCLRVLGDTLVSAVARKLSNKCENEPSFEKYEHKYVLI